MNQIDLIARERNLVTALLEAIPEPVMVVGEDDRLVATNGGARTLFPALRIGELLAFFLRAPEVLDTVARVRDSSILETVAWRERVPLERIFEVRVAPLAWTTFGRAVVITLVDLTESRRVEKMRVDFVANASHELRTPLASLLGFVETLQGAARDDPKARSRFLDIMREQAQRMARLVDDLLSLSRIEQNLHLRPEARVDFSGVVSHMIDSLQPVAIEAGVTIIGDVCPDVIVPGDRDELLRIAENLIENAIKYGAAGPDSRIEVTLKSVARQAVLTVRDFGAGIAPEHLPRLTERFYRVDAGQSRARGGTGLGLAIVKHIVARHRGRLHIESRPGEGATFTVMLSMLD